MQIPNIIDDVNLKAIIAVINKHTEGYIVGGYVRDWIRSECRSNDIDIAVKDLSPGLMQEMQTLTGLSILPQALNYNALTLMGKNLEITITELRSDVASYGRQAKTIKVCNIKDDASRRDFTVNAIYSDFRGNIYDFFGGIADLKRHEVIFIGDAETRIREDYLRIIRYFRFSSVMQANYSVDILNIIKNNIEGLKKFVSKERIAKEVCKIIASDNCLDTLMAMQKSSTLDCICGLEVSEKAIVQSLRLKKMLQNLQCSEVVVVATMAILSQQNTGQAMPELLLPFTKKERKLINFMFQYRNQASRSIKDFWDIKILHSDIFINALMCLHDKDSKSLKDMQDYDAAIAKFPINIGDVAVIEGIQGSDIRLVFNKLRFTWLDNMSLSGSQLLKMAQHIKLP